MNIMSINVFQLEELNEIFNIAYRFENGDKDNCMSGKIMSTLFFEPSTRTKLSFESAMIRLGGNCISADSKGSSILKGESMNDTIMTVSQYSDVIVIRTSDNADHWYDKDIKCNSHIINAGNGGSDHPTQALLDAYTIWKRNFNLNKKLKIAIVGDLEQSRTISSFIEIMSRYSSKFYLFNSTSHPSKRYENLKNVQFLDNVGFENILPHVDVLYTNRVQKERWSLDVSKNFVLTHEHLDSLNKKALIMNPGPRKEELPAEFDSDKRVVFFEQAKNGMFIRMALLEWLSRTGY